jgi:hypothetical protein
MRDVMHACGWLTDVGEVRGQGVDSPTKVHVLWQPEHIVTILK